MSFHLNSHCKIKSIVLVEDDPNIREPLAQLLRLEGYGVSEAANGSEGLNLLRKSTSPCLVLLDLIMPVMTGWEFLAAKVIDTVIADIPVIVLSAATNGENCAGADVTLEKPVEFWVLLEQIQYFCGNPAAP